MLVISEITMTLPILPGIMIDRDNALVGWFRDDVESTATQRKPLHWWFHVVDGSCRCFLYADNDICVSKLDDNSSSIGVAIPTLLL